MASIAAVILFATAVQAFPSLSTRQSITALATSQIDQFTPYTYYASAGYCTNTQTLAWDCGTNCDANPGFKPVASGGNGDSVQYWFVGYDPNLDTVIVSHQGTNPSEILPLVTDADFFLTTLDSTLFPGISSDIEVHNGFQDAQTSTATDVLAAVESAMSTYGTTSVTMVGHSLGAAITLLDSVYLPLWLPAGTTFTTIGYGLPRVGNQAFADYVDANLHLTHINNEEDPIPICPGIFLDFVHPAGEVHIQDSGEWASCPGQDNPSTQCIVGDVPEIWDGDESDHDGPYNGVEMRC
ncbi:Alpha/Beta hydrolase protein [Suillus fuscotomentosus]|uniref:Alpha/Beta hydrolase protein n=1 Tax=Suillus fuscotomentosus TaxID=1912939 RepID=A0AAD4ENL9_9AGAM|nr:Alpha/Beta hydrolase protein [Suillus fuscotomentosus]KAG1908103.1 Alpha/Beta hydrolase protein [Suillus fuscotomentosus]